MSSSSVRAILFWRKSDFYKTNSIRLIARCEPWCRILQQEMCASQNTPVYINYQT